MAGIALDADRFVLVRRVKNGVPCWINLRFIVAVFPAEDGKSCALWLYGHDEAVNIAQPFSDFVSSAAR